jgi:predicted metalloprotease with PDZ domain
MLGDYEASTHLQGELLATMLEMMILDHTDGRKSLDDVWPLLLHHSASGRGFENGDIEAMLESLCQCSLKDFFQSHIAGNQPIPFNTYLSLVGLQADTLWKIAKNDQGMEMADNSGYAWQKPGDSLVRIGITDPLGAWGKAGLHTGNLLLTLNGYPLKTTQDFRTIMDSISPGQLMSVSWRISNMPVRGSILFGPQLVPEAKVNLLPQLSAKQKKLLARWEAGK